jgi:superfamily II DNA helicase RecQ
MFVVVIRCHTEQYKMMLHIQFPCQILISTDAGKCGISSSHLGLVIRDELPPSLVHWSQESGRTARTKMPGVHYSYHIFARLTGVSALIKRIYDGKKKTSRQMVKLLDVVKLAISNTCYHQALEQHFGCPQELFDNPFLSTQPNAFAELPCRSSCSVCSGERTAMCKVVKRGALKDFLFSQKIDYPKSTLVQLCQQLNAAKKEVWKDSNRINTRHVQMLMLQLLAARIIEEGTLDDNVVVWKLGKRGQSFALSDDIFGKQLITNNIFAILLESLISSLH